MKCIRLQKHAGIREIVKSPSVKKRSYKRMVALDVVRPKSSDLIDLMEGHEIYRIRRKITGFCAFGSCDHKDSKQSSGTFPP